jgi:hypothetical protein
MQKRRLALAWSAPWLLWFACAAMGPLGASGCSQYTNVGNCWGLKMATGDSNANAPKYQGVLNWLAAHP